MDVLALWGFPGSAVWPFIQNLVIHFQFGFDSTAGGSLCTILGPLFDIKY